MLVHKLPCKGGGREKNLLKAQVNESEKTKNVTRTVSEKDVIIIISRVEIFLTFPIETTRQALNNIS